MSTSSLEESKKKLKTSKGQINKYSFSNNNIKGEPF